MSSTNEKTTKGSLMKKTKAELVSIILRKDSVDKEKQAVIDELHKKAVTKVEYETIKDNYLESLNKIKDLEKELANINDNYNKLDSRNAELNKLNNSLKDSLSEDTNVIQKTKSNLKFWRGFAIAYFLITVLVVILKVIM